MSRHWGGARKHLRVQYPKPPFLGNRGLAIPLQPQSPVGSRRGHLQEGGVPRLPHAYPGQGEKRKIEVFFPAGHWAARLGQRVVAASLSPVPRRASPSAIADLGQLSHGPGAPGFGFGGRGAFA